MRLPRDLSGDDLGKALSTFGYHIVRQSGSHLRLTTTQPDEHYVTIPPRHDALRIGALAAILTDITGHVGMTRDDVAARLFGEG